MHSQQQNQQLIPQKLNRFRSPITHHIALKLYSKKVVVSPLRQTLSENENFNRILFKKNTWVVVIDSDLFNVSLLLDDFIFFMSAFCSCALSAINIYWNYFEHWAHIIFILLKGSVCFPDYSVIAYISM